MSTDKNNFGGKEDMMKEVKQFSEKYGIHAFFKEFVSSPESQTTIRTHYERTMQRAFHLIDEAPEDLKEALDSLKKGISGYSLEDFTDFFITMMEVDLFKAAKILPDAMREIFEREVDEEKETESFIEFLQIFLSTENDIMDLDSMLEPVDDAFVEFVAHEIVTRVIHHNLPDPIKALVMAMSDLGIGVGVGVLVPVDPDEEDSEE